MGLDKNKSAIESQKKAKITEIESREGYRYALRIKDESTLDVFKLMSNSLNPKERATFIQETSHMRPVDAPVIEYTNHLKVSNYAVPENNFKKVKGFDEGKVEEEDLNKYFES